MSKIAIGTKVTHNRFPQYGAGTVIPVPERYDGQEWANDGRTWIQFDEKRGESWARASELTIIGIPKFKFNIGDNVTAIDTAERFGICWDNYKKFVDAKCEISHRFNTDGVNWYELENDSMKYAFNETSLKLWVNYPDHLQVGTHVKLIDESNLGNGVVIPVPDDYKHEDWANRPDHIWVRWENDEELHSHPTELQVIEPVKQDEPTMPIELSKDDYIKIFDYVNLRNCYIIAKIFHVGDDFYTCTVHKQVWMGETVGSPVTPIMVPKIGTMVMDGEDSPRIELIG